MARELAPRCDDAALMRAAAEGIDHVALALLAMHDRWQGEGAPSEALEWLCDLTTELGWWSGRLTGAASRARPAARASSACLRRR